MMKHFATSAFVVLLLGWRLAPVFADSQSFKERAIWVSGGSFASAAAADEMLGRCQKAGINLILPNVMCHQTVSFKSPHFRGRVPATDGFDPLAYVLGKAHAIGIRVQPWCCVYYEGARGRSNRSSNPAWLNRSIDGRLFEQNFLSPSNPEVNPYLLTVIEDLLAYKIDGIHLDYIRYPGTAFDYSDAGRTAFKADSGFDPQDFLDHAERIVPPEQERFPIRVLHPKSHAEKVWELTAIERTLDQAGIGFAYVSEEPGLVEELRVPGLLILSSYYEVSPGMAQVLAAYVSRGGNILWTDVPARALAQSVMLQELTGITAGRWLGECRIQLQPAGDQAPARMIPTSCFRTESAQELRLNGANVIANLDSGEPAITLKVTGKGRVMVTSFHLMKSTSPVVAMLAREIVNWLRAEARVSSLDPVAAKRAEWVKWRGGRVTQLVRDLSRAAKQINPQLMISSSGGPSPYEFYGCYRDSGRWLAEGINDQVFPMNYTPDPAALSDMLELQARSAPTGKRDRIFPGLQIYASQDVDGKRVTRPIAGDIVEKELRVVQQQGYKGFCLFAYDYLSDDIIDVLRKFSR
jgi:uncharacterized lipoprotein YddW (UPF0748 family)